LKADEEVRRTGEKLVIPIERNTAWDEKKHWLNTIKVPLINDDGTRYVIRVSTFIDDVMEMAEKVKRQEDLSTLASNIAHKLGTRIFTLRNLVAITHHGADESDLSAAFDDITEFAEGFLKLTSADRINAQPLNLLNLVHQALKSFAEKATIILNGVIVSSRGDSLNKFGNPLQFEMTGDSAKLFDIFAELARNSLAWKKEDVHRINVSLQPLHRTNPSIVNSPDSGRFQIIFEDNGPGVPLHQKKKIFEPFVSGRAASLMPENGDAISAAKNDRRGSGTGLGLAIADEVMKSHGGHILENGVPGAGARFVMMLQKMPPAQSIVQQSTSHQ
jgi:signal transduction histidine kinase